MPANFGIMVHGGASTDKKRKSEHARSSISKALSNSVIAGYELLRSGHDAIDGVESAVAYMEDSGLFNAGAGSCLTLDKSIEMDASVMNGKDLAAGSVGMVQNVQNPVRLARLVMERTDHVMLVSTGAYELARLLDVGIKRFVPTPTKLDKYERLYKEMKTRWSRNHELLLPSGRHLGTVGAVALDRHGNVAAAVSTGGRWLKMHGRVGDSAVIGAGIYADNESGAACATGHGELMIRLCLSKYTCDLMKKSSNNVGDSSRRGTSPSKSAKEAIALLTKRFGANTGGIIAIDTKGRFGFSTNTESMPVAVKSSTYDDHNGDEKTWVIFEKNSSSKKFHALCSSY
jgi:beta-aspartyl-peptidase (threonine type)